MVTFNRKFIEEKIISICDGLGLTKNFDSFLKWILDLRQELEIPHKLSDVIDIEKINLEELSIMALNDPSTSSNPQKLTINDMKIMYQNSISGKLI